MDLHNDTDTPEQLHWHGQAVPVDVDGSEEEGTPNAAEHGFNVWTINGVPFSMEKMEPIFQVRQGKRYRWRMRNASDDLHPMHLHRHSFELTKIAGKATAGVLKDVVMVGGYQEVEVEFTADNPGLTLFHCHMQLQHGLRLHGPVQVRLNVCRGRGSTAGRSIPASERALRSARRL